MCCPESGAGVDVAGRTLGGVDDLDVVDSESAVGRDEWDALELSLRDKEAIEWIAVMSRQRRDLQGV